MVEKCVRAEDGGGVRQLLELSRTQQQSDKHARFMQRLAERAHFDHEEAYVQDEDRLS